MTQLDLAKTEKHRSYVRPSLLALTAFFAASSLTPATAHAEGVDPAQIEALQNQIKQLQAEIDGLVANQVSVSKKITKVATTTPKVIFKAGKFSLSSADGQNTIALTGRLHLDAGTYVADKRKTSFGASGNNLNGGFNARRARIGVVGKLGGVWGYSFIYDAGNSDDSTPKGIQTAQISYNGFKKTAIEFGYSDTYFSLDESTSSNDIMFMERASPGAIATSIAAGDFRSNAGVRHWGDRYWVGAYFTGPAQGQAHNVAQQFGAIQRATYQVLSAKDYSVHLGAGAEELLKGANTGAGTATALTLSDAPELRIDKTALLTTGALGTVANPLIGADVINAEVAAVYRNIYLQGEYFHYAIDRRGLKNAAFNGAYGEAAWTITGESHKYKPDSGAYGSISPDHPVDFKEGGIGAWELAARVSYVGLDDNFVTGQTLATAPSAVAGGDQLDYTAGVNWYVNNNMRFMLNYVHANIRKTSITAGASLGKDVGASIDAVGVRAQVQF